MSLITNTTSESSRSFRKSGGVSGHTLPEPRAGSDGGGFNRRDTKDAEERSRSRKERIDDGRNAPYSRVRCSR